MELNLVCNFPRELSVAILWEGKRIDTFIPTNGRKTGFSGWIGDWTAVSD